MSHHLLGCAAHKNTRQAGTPVGGGNDQIDVLLFRETADLWHWQTDLHRGLEFYTAKLRAPDKRLHLVHAVTDRACLPSGKIINGKNIGRIGVGDVGDVKHKDPSREQVSDLNGILQPGQSGLGEIDRNKQFIDFPDHLAQDEYWTGRMLRHAFRCAAEKEMLQPGSAMSRHDNQVRLHRKGHLADLIKNGRALLNVTMRRRDLIPVRQLFQILCQPPACLIEKRCYRHRSRFSRGHVFEEMMIFADVDEMNRRGKRAS